MTDTVTSTETTESVAEFAARARSWLAENMQPVDPDNPPFSVRAEQQSWDHAKADSVWTPPTKGRSTPRPAVTRCR